MIRIKLRSFLLFVCIVMTAGIYSGCAAEKEEPSPQPRQNPDVKESQQYVDLDIEEVKALQAGDEYRMVTGENDTLLLIVNRVQNTMPGVKAISADIENKETGLATLVFSEGEVTGSLDIYSDSLLYYIRYDSLEQSYFIREINKKDLDQMEGSDPLEIPEDG